MTPWARPDQPCAPPNAPLHASWRCALVLPARRARASPAARRAPWPALPHCDSRNSSPKPFSAPPWVGALRSAPASTSSSRTRPEAGPHRRATSVREVQPIAPCWLATTDCGRFHSKITPSGVALSVRLSYGAQAQAWCLRAVDARRRACWWMSGFKGRVRAPTTLAESSPCCPRQAIQFMPGLPAVAGRTSWSCRRGGHPSH